MRDLKKYDQERLLFFDIETAPLVKELEIDSPLYNSWDYKVNKTGELTAKEVQDSYFKEAGLYPEFAKVVSIVVGKIVNEEIVLITLDDSEENQLLTRFNALLERNIKDVLTGFVNTGFDTPFVAKRMLINGIQPHDKLDSSGLKPWEVSELDLAKSWQLTSFTRASLIHVATAFGLPSPKNDISGADVGRVYWNEGEKGLQRISKYCRQDVVTTINIFRKMRLQEPLKVNQGSLEVEPVGIIDHLVAGGTYGAKEKKQLLDTLKGMGEEERELAFVVLDASVSGAKGKKTKITKVHVRALRKELDGN